MMGFRPEPIAIPQPQASSSLQLPLQSTELTAAPSIARAPSADLRISAVPSASAAGIAGGAASSEIEPLEQLIVGGQSEIQHADLQVLHNIGHGSSGVVQKVLHIPSDSILALKIIPVEADEAKRKQILLELKTLHEASHPSIVSFFGAFYREGAVHVALEFMDASLLDISRGVGVAFPEPVLGALALPVLHGLVYMHREKHVIHRDIKPSNLLVDASGHVKIADFGVSGELHHTLAKCASWVGTVHYMSPERIQGSSYSYDSDVWSLGITMLELATAAFPYPPERNGRRLSFWDLLDAIVESPPPTPPPHFAAPFHGFIGACLQKEPSRRTSSSQLLHHPLLSAYAGQVDLAEWLRGEIARLPPRGAAGEDSGGLSGDSGSGPAAGAGAMGEMGEASLGSTLPGGGFGGGGFGGGGFGGGGGGFGGGGDGGGGGGDAQTAAMLASIMGGGTVQQQAHTLLHAPSYEHAPNAMEDAEMVDA